MWLHSFWRAFQCLVLLHLCSSRSNLGKSKEKKPKPFYKSAGRKCSIVLPLKTMNKPVCPLWSTATMWMQHEVLLKIYSKPYTFLSFFLICYLPPSTLLIHQPTTSFCLAVTLLVALEQSRGGTFEVGQVAAGNAESFMQTGSSRWEREEQDTLARPQATRGGEREERGRGKKMGREREDRKGAWECDGDWKIALVMLKRKNKAWKKDRREKIERRRERSLN